MLYEQDKINMAINSYKDFKELIKGHTSETMRKRYNKHYYCVHVGGKELSMEYFESLGLRETKYTKTPLEIAKIIPGDQILDIGCGRGELVFQSARLGAVACGIDYSDSAINIAEQTRKKLNDDIRSRTEFKCMKATSLMYEDRIFDKAFLVDVVEHVSKKELKDILKEIKRVLKRSGKLIIHTSPNRWSSTYGYYLKYLIHLFWRGERIVHPIVGHYRMMKKDDQYNEQNILLHINEQSIASLKYLLWKCGFRSKVWMNNYGNIDFVHNGYVKRVVQCVYRMLGMKYIYGSDICVVANPK